MKQNCVAKLVSYLPNFILPFPEHMNHIFQTCLQLGMDPEFQQVECEQK